MREIRDVDILIEIKDLRVVLKELEKIEILDDDGNVTGYSDVQLVSNLERIVEEVDGIDVVKYDLLENI